MLGCVCRCASSACSRPFLDGAGVVWVGCCLAPVSVPWFVSGCARCPLLRHSVAVVAWHLSVCLGGPRGPVLVRRTSSGPVALGSPVGLPDAVVPFRTPGACAPGFTGPLRRARGGRLRTGLIVPAPGPCRCRGAELALRCTCSGPAMGFSLTGLSGVGLELLALRWYACVDPVIDASGFPYRSSFVGGSGRCTGAVLCGRRHRPIRVGGRHTRVPCVCACACPSCPD